MGSIIKEKIDVAGVVMPICWLLFQTKLFEQVKGRTVTSELWPKLFNFRVGIGLLVLDFWYRV